MNGNNAILPELWHANVGRGMWNQCRWQQNCRLLQLLLCKWKVCARLLYGANDCRLRDTNGAGKPGNDGGKSQRHDGGVFPNPQTLESITQKELLYIAALFYIPLA